MDVVHRSNSGSPLHRGDAARTQPPPDTALARRRVLIADDSALVRRAVTERLRAEGCDVVAVASGEDAIEAAMLSGFDLVVSDVRMGAMTGVQLCRVLRSDPLTSRLPVILLTASDDPRSRFWGRNAGADAYIAKDSHLDHLCAAAVDLLRNRPRVEANATVRPRRVDAAARVSAVLDRHLFEAVVAAEARSLMSHIEERPELLAAAIALAADVLSAPIVAISITAPGSVSHAVLARVPFVESDSVIEALSLESCAEPVQIVRRDPAIVSSVGFRAGACETFPLVTAGRDVGRLRLYGGAMRVGTDDRETAALLAASFAPLVTSALLVEQTRSLARTDQLTGLANRRTLVERLDLEGRRAARYGSPMAALMVDVDHFKTVNDRYGHPMGDRVLEKVARTLEAQVRGVDLVGRWGGEEFLVVLPNCDREGAVVVAERMCAGVRALEAFDGGPARVTVSCGCAVSDGTPDAVGRLVECADGALYEAKRGGRDRAVLAREER